MSIKKNSKIRLSVFLVLMIMFSFISTYQPKHVHASTCLHSSVYVSTPQYESIFRNVGGNCYQVITKEQQTCTNSRCNHIVSEVVKSTVSYGHNEYHRYTYQDGTFLYWEKVCTKCNVIQDILPIWRGVYPY